MNVLAWRYKRFHISYLLGWLCFGVLVGLGCAQAWIFTISTLFIVSIWLVVLSMFHQRRWWSVGIIILCGVTLGWARGSEFAAQLSPFEQYVGQTVAVKGIIKDDPQYGDRGDQKFRISDVEISGKRLPGEVYVGTYTILDVKRGHAVELEGKLREGFGNYQASLGFAKLVSASATRDPVRELRDTFAASVRGAVEEPAASLGIGFVVGQRSALPEELDEKLRIVGLTHIVVASGYNLTILVRFARRLLEKHSKYLATLVSGTLMAGFVAVSGLSPSMTRASLVTGLSLLAWYYGRRFHPLLLIFYVAAITAYIYPVYIWSDIGWYLSFLAFAGVLISAPLIVKMIYRNRQPRALSQIVIETSAAQLMTLPLILAVFGDLPLLSIISNALIAPLIPLAMLLISLTGMMGMIAPSAAAYIGTGAEIVLGYILSIVEWLAAPAWSQINVSINGLVMVLCYLGIFFIIWWIWRRLQYNFRSSSVVE